MGRTINPENKAEPFSHDKRVIKSLGLTVKKKNWIYERSQKNMQSSSLFPDIPCTQLPDPSDPLPTPIHGRCSPSRGVTGCCRPALCRRPSAGEASDRRPAPRRGSSWPRSPAEERTRVVGTNPTGRTAVHIRQQLTTGFLPVGFAMKSQYA